MLVGGSSSSSSLSELASPSTQHRSSRHTRPPTRTSTVARSSSVPECSGRLQVACRVSGEQAHDMPAIRREPRRTRGQGETGRRRSRRGWPFDRARGEWNSCDLRRWTYVHSICQRRDSIAPQLEFRLRMPLQELHRFLAWLWPYPKCRAYCAHARVMQRGLLRPATLLHHDTLVHVKVPRRGARRRRSW